MGDSRIRVSFGTVFGAEGQGRGEPPTGVRILDSDFQRGAFAMVFRALQGIRVAPRIDSSSAGRQRAFELVWLPLPCG